MSDLASLLEQCAYTNVDDKGVYKMELGDDHLQKVINTVMERTKGQHTAWVVDIALSQLYAAEGAILPNQIMEQVKKFGVERPTNVLIPVLVQDPKHFFLLVYSPDKNNYTVFDSIPNANRGSLNDPYVKYLTRNLFPIIARNNAPLSMVRGRCDRQIDSNSCGFYVLCFAEHILCNLQPIKVMESKDKVLAYRAKIEKFLSNQYKKQVADVVVAAAPAPVASAAITISSRKPSYKAVLTSPPRPVSTPNQPSIPQFTVGDAMVVSKDRRVKKVSPVNKTNVTNPNVSDNTVSTSPVVSMSNVTSVPCALVSKPSNVNDSPLTPPSNISTPVASKSNQRKRRSDEVDVDIVQRMIALAATPSTPKTSVPRKRKTTPRKPVPENIEDLSLFSKDQVYRMRKSLGVDNDNEAVLAAARVRKDKLRASVEKRRREQEADTTAHKTKYVRKTINFFNAAADKSVCPDYMSLGKMEECMFDYCRALKFKQETSGVCCSNGAVNVSDAPSIRSNLMVKLYDVAKEKRSYYNNFHNYNKNLAMASLIMRRSDNIPKGDPVVVVQGKMSTGVCHLLPSETGKPGFAHMYYVPGAKEDIWSRMAESDDVDRKLLEELYEILCTHNPYTAAYKSTYKLYMDLVKMNIDSGRPDLIPCVGMKFVSYKDRRASNLIKGHHPGTLNVPGNKSEVAVLYGDADGSPPTLEQLKESSWVMTHNWEARPMPHYDTHADPLMFPVLFPEGNPFFRRFVKRNGYISEEDEDDNDDDAHDNSILNIHGDQEGQLSAGDLTDNEEDESDKSKKKVKKRKFVSYSELARYSYRRTIDNKDLHWILGAGKMLQLHGTFTFTRIEAERLAQIRRKQQELLKIEHNEYFNWMKTRMESKGIQVGQFVYMPAVFVGSKKWCEDNYNNAMAVAAQCGKPHLFITLTGNPGWSEVSDNLVGKNAMDDPDLLARVCKLKFDQAWDLIKNKEIFGKVKAIWWRIEFQKRGVPHCHMLVTLEKDIPEEDIPKYISAEIPVLPDKSDPNYDKMKKLKELVLSHMVHNPCVGKNHYTCRKDNPQYCKKRFPKPFRDEMIIDKHGMPHYPRPNNGEWAFLKDGETQVTNRDIVPFNHFLMLALGTHCNVEYCGSSASYKYISKYLTKGVDTLLAAVASGNMDKMKEYMKMGRDGVERLYFDEGEEFVKLRYLSACEAFYRLHNFNLVRSTHNVKPIGVHLPGEQPIYFEKGKIPKLGKSKSMFIAYMEKVSNDPEAAHLTFEQLTREYRYNPKTATYTKYKRDKNVVTRLFQVNPRNVEKFALRLIVQSRPVKSFENARTVNNVVYDTFNEAAIVAGLIHNDRTWDECMAEACHTGMPKRLRVLFASILMHCSPPDPLGLWNKYKEKMAPRNTNRSLEENLATALRRLKWILGRNGRTLSEYGLPEPNGGEEEDIDGDGNDNGNAANNPLNEGQSRIVSRVMAAVHQSKESRGNVCFSMQGSGGTGKTYVYNKIIALCKKDNYKVLVVSSTGIAATLLQGGQTSHSAFKLPPKLDKDSVSRIKAHSDEGKRLREVDLIIWDECTMSIMYALECVNNVLKLCADDVNRDKPFGGVVILCGGDWKQLLPVMEGQDPVVSASVILKRSPLWTMFETFTLTENMRVKQGEAEFAKYLELVGTGQHEQVNGRLMLPEQFLVNSESDIINWLYTPTVLMAPTEMAKVAILVLKNVDSLRINEQILNMCVGQTFTAVSTDSPIDLVSREASKDLAGRHRISTSVEHIWKETPSGFPPHKLHLKVGCIIMLLRNLNVAAGLCNGTRLEVVSFSQHMLECKNVTTNDDDTVFIPKIKLTYEDRRNDLAFERWQFPVRLSYAMTINKSQGQTFDKVGIILKSQPFAHGQFYVGLSRIRSADGLKVFASWGNRTHSNGTSAKPIHNVVYKDVL